MLDWVSSEETDGPSLSGRRLKTLKVKRVAILARNDNGSTSQNSKFTNWKRWWSTGSHKGLRPHHQLECSASGSQPTPRENDPSATILDFVIPNADVDAEDADRWADNEDSD